MKHIKLLIAFLLAGVLVALGLNTSAVKAAADEGVGQCIANPATVKKIVHDAVTEEQNRWKQTIPGVDAVSHVEKKFYRDIPEVPGTPGTDETFTTWYKWQKTIPATEGVSECQYKKWVEDSKTQYKYAKYTHTKTRTSEIWANFSPNDKHGTYEGTPSWPTDPNGKWEVHGDIPPGHAGPDGVYQKGGGNGDWFYRHAAGDWSDYGPWTQWTPLTHVTWEDFDQPSIGDPAFHGQGSDDGTDWYREWQLRNTGETRTVADGWRWEYKWFTEDPGEGWTKTDNCRWKVEPTAESIEPYKDGEWTKDVLSDPWVKVAEESRGNGDGTEAIPAIPGYREYLMTGSDTSRKLEDAVWRLEGSLEGWSVLDIRTVVTTEAVAPYDIYFLPGGEPTLTIGEENWTNTAPGEPWGLVDTRDHVVKEAWTEKIDIPATYKDCPTTLADTGMDEDFTSMLLYAGGGVIAIGLILLVIPKLIRRKTYK